VEENTNEKYLVFALGDKQYALPSKIISEVAAVEKVFPLPLVPDYVCGIINRYSIPYALVDINILFFKTASAARKVIVLKQEIDRLGFIIDDVTDIADIPPEQLMKTELDEDGATASVTAFFEWKGNHVFCLDTQELLSRIKHDFE